MISLFPHFKHLQIEDKQKLETLTKQYPPYSDYNFISLFGWNSKPGAEITLLNNNLVIKMNDYLTHAPFLSFLGVEKIINTTSTLLEYAKVHKYLPGLHLVPEVVIKTEVNLDKHFFIEEDRDNFDYIYPIEDYLKLEGQTFAVKRNFINRFKKKYQSSHCLLDIHDPKIQTQLIHLFETWRHHRRKEVAEVRDELSAIRRILDHSHHLELVVVGLFVDNEIVGFSVNEILSDGYAMNLFEKANIQYEGSFAYLRLITHQYLGKSGSTLFNFEQDLGLEGLRKAKMSYRPKFFLKKYTLSRLSK